MSPTNVCVPPQADNLFGQISCRHIDTIGIFAGRPWPGIVRSIAATLGDPSKELVATTNRWGLTIRIHHPTTRTQLLLARWQFQGRHFKINRIDIAHDHHCVDATSVSNFMRRLRKRLRLKWGSVRARPIDFENGFYLVDYESNKRMRRNVCVYQRGLAVRVELRFLGSDAVERNGLDDMHGIRNVASVKLFDKHLRMQTSC